MISSQILIVLNSIFIDVVLGRRLWENNCSALKKWQMEDLLISKVAWRGLSYSMPK